MGVYFFENGSLFFEMGVCFTKMGVCFFVCDLLISGCRLSPPMSIALSGYTLATVLFN